MSRNSLASYVLRPRNDSGKRRKSSRSRRGASPRWAHVPRKEALEARLMLSTISVVNTDDSGPGYLRAAIDVANSSVGVPHVIEFAAGVQGTIGLTSGQLEITDQLTINGPGQGRFAV